MALSIIGETISRLRTKLGVTQENLADAVGVSSQAVPRWEGGGTPDTELLPDIAKYFDVSIDTLFGRNVLSLRPAS